MLCLVATEQGQVNVVTVDVTSAAVKGVSKITRSMPIRAPDQVSNRTQQEWLRERMLSILCFRSVTRMRKLHFAALYNHLLRNAWEQVPRLPRSDDSNSGAQHIFAIELCSGTAGLTAQLRLHGFASSLGLITL